MLLHPGTQERYISETTIGSGSSSVEGSIQSDSLLATLFIDSISSGTLDVSLYTLTAEGKATLLFSFPQLSAPSTTLLLKKSAVSMQRFLIKAIYTGVCSYEVYVRAITGAGESSTKILGSPTWAVSQEDVSATAIELIPSSLLDRQGILIKNWSQASTVYLAETEAKALNNIGYPLGPRDAVAMDIAAGASVWAIADFGTADIRIAESGGT